MGNRIDLLRQTKTAETDTSLALHPDGTGGTAWGTGGGGGGSSCCCELLIESGTSAPPVPLTNEDEDDFVYSDC